LLEATGIKSDVGSLRQDINDYNAKDTGLTWEIFRSNKSEVFEFKSVIQDNRWSGLNTKIFYEKILRESCINNIEYFENQDAMKKFLEHYTIALIGIPIIVDGENIGVLKVEFPAAYDYAYDTNDKRFLEKCAVALKDELVLLSSFLSMEWFRTADASNAKEFFNLLVHVYKVDLLIKLSNKDVFNQKVENYARRFRSDIESLFKNVNPTYSEKELLNRFPKPRLQAIKTLFPNLPPKIIKELLVEILIRSPGYFID